jgi:hypothetical protein
MYEYFPCFCKQCRVLGHSVSTCNKGTSSKHKKRAHEAPTCSGNSSPSAETTAVEKQQPYSAIPLVDPEVDPMFTEAITTSETRSKSPSRKSIKIIEVEHSSSEQSATLKVLHIFEEGDVAAVEPLKRQYLTRSRAATTTNLGQQEKQKSKAPTIAPKLLSSFDDTTPSSTFFYLYLISLYCGSIFDREVVPLVSLLACNC